ncbi:hypothetical protein T261_3973 [Streptomyces lydicus]|nr:hypothetical protein T261_3973 [Streptomyces lydicus]
MDDRADAASGAMLRLSALVVVRGSEGGAGALVGAVREHEDRGLPSAAGLDDAVATSRCEVVQQAFEAIKRVVVVLNEINDDHDGAGYETEEREQPCLYIDQTLTDHGIDVPALAARRGVSRTEITDSWRDW